VGQTSRNLKHRYQEHIRYIRNNDHQSAFAQHILNNQHEYGTIEEIMKLLKPINHPSMLIPYELFFIQSHHQQGQLIAEQNQGESNPLIQLGLDTIVVRQSLGQGHVTTNLTLSLLVVNKPNLDLLMMTSYDNKPNFPLTFYDVICTQN
jgi:hypothetical protein